MKKGLIHIYSGDGKGKTTASVGLAVRALGHGFKVVYSSFFKRPGENGYCEIDVMRKLGADVFSFAEGMPMANPQITPEEYSNSTISGLKILQKTVHDNKTQLLVLDEILIAVNCAYLSEADLLEFIENKPESLELVLTGRGASEELIGKADYVTIMTKEKHPYEKGIVSRVGIEY